MTGEPETTSTAKDSPKRVSPLVALLASLATALLGFLGGIAQNQSGELVTSAQQCYAALNDYGQGLGQLSVVAPIFSNPYSATAQVADAMNTGDERISKPYFDALGKCSTDYLASDQYEEFQRGYDDIGTCFTDKPSCTPERAEQLYSQYQPLNNSLLQQANAVRDWGVLRRGLYTLRHLW